MATLLGDQLRLVRVPPAALPASRVLIVSNRLPLTADVACGDVRLHRTDGGLIAALERVHRQTHGLWIGWPGTSSDLAPQLGEVLDRRLREAGAEPLHLDDRELDGFYRRYANEVLWPVLHGLAPAEAPGAWSVYRRVNERYADAVARHARPGDRVWIHDYHLMLVPRLVRRRRPDVRIGFFLHTPFPALPIWRAVEHHVELLDGLLGADVVGFHTRGYVQHFVQAVQRSLGHEANVDSIVMRERTVHAHAVPIGIDPAAYEVANDQSTIALDVPAIARPRSGPLFLGVDRLDYTKGIPQRLQAFELLLERRPDLVGRARLVQLAVPSREEVAGYAETREAVEAIVERINARFGTDEWCPVEYLYRRVSRETLVAMYRAADVMLVTPLADGMNLVAKEFAAARRDVDGVLVLSERAGAAGELRAALLVDPTDVGALASAYEAALEMTPQERRVRMRRIRRAVLDHDVFDWASECLSAMNVPV
jgi:trehalose 6-phosphate synthase/phosphatase